MTSAAPGPLTGLTVVELAGIGPAPFAAMILADLGADVVRVDRPGGNTPLSVAAGLGRSRPSIAVDLKHPDGLATVRRLIDGADILVEGLRPGVTERLGLGPQECLARNPRLIYGRMTGWGQTGPLAHRAGHDITYAALTGALHLMGPPEKPMAPVNVLADFGGGALYLLVGLLAAVHAREGTGSGQVVDAAMVDGAASLVTLFYGMYAAGLWQDERGVNLLDGGAPFYDTYECADGKFVAVGALEPQFYAELLDGLGLDLEVPQYDPAGFAAQREAFSAAFRSRTRDAWAARFAGTDACVAPVLSLAEAPSHPHISARGTFADVGGHAVPRVAPRFSATPAPDPGREPAVGGDTTAYLLGHGFTEAEVSGLLRSGAVVQTQSRRARVSPPG